MKKTSLLSMYCALGMVLLTAAAGCKSSNEENGTAAASGPGTETNKSDGAKTEAANNASGETVTLTFLTNEAESDDGLNYYEEVIQAFEAKHPNIKIELLQGGDWKDMETKLNAAVLSDTYPDVILAPLNSFSSRAALGDYMDITTYIDGWEDKEDIFEASINIGKYKGTNYGIGAFPVPEIIMYRKDFFEEAGLDPEKPPVTWDDLYEYAKKLVQYDESGNVVRGGFDVPMADPNATMLEAFLRQNGNPVIDTVNEKITIVEPSGVETLAFLKQFVTEKLTIPYRRGTDDPVLSGKSAMGIVYLNGIEELLREDPALEDKLGFIPFVENKEKASFTGYRVMMIGNTTKYPDEAWEFIKFFYEPDIMWKRFEQLKNIPVRKSLADEYIAVNPLVNEVSMQCVEYGAGRPVIGWVPTFTKYETQAYEEVMNEVKTPEQALNDAVQAVNVELGLQ